MKLVWMCVAGAALFVGLGQLGDMKDGVRVVRGTPPEISIDIPADWPKEDQQTAFHLLTKTCPDVARYWDQMTKKRVEFLDADAAENFGLTQNRG